MCWVRVGYVLALLHCQWVVGGTVSGWWVVSACCASQQRQWHPGQAWRPPPSPPPPAPACLRPRATCDDACSRPGMRKPTNHVRARVCALAPGMLHLLSTPPVNGTTRLYPRPAARCPPLPSPPPAPACKHRAAPEGPPPRRNRPPHLHLSPPCSLHTRIPPPTTRRPASCCP